MSRPRSNVRKRKSSETGQLGSSPDDDLDQFDFKVPINYETDICALCKEGNQYGVEFTKIMEGLFLQGLKDGDDDGKDYNDDDFEDDYEDLNKFHGATTSPSKSKLSFVHKSNNVDQIKFLDPNDDVKKETVWFSKYSIALGNRRVFVHYYCALFSPQTRFDGKKWRNVRKEVLRSSGLKCDSCSIKGATLSCGSEKKCSAVYHLPCAVKLGSLSTDYYNNYTKFYCPAHVTMKKTINDKLDAVASEDVSKGRECIPIKVKNDIDNISYCQPCDSSSATADNLFNFSYILHNLDSDDVIATSQNVSNIECCDCAGLCNNIETCSCLRNERSYSNKEVLIASSSSQIFECNMRCRCSSRRCTNRVVEQGIKFQFEVYRAMLKDNISSNNSNNDNMVCFIIINSYYLIVK